MLEIALSLVTLFIVVLVFVNEYYQQKLGVSMMPSMSKVRYKMLGLIPADNEGKIVELGSGWGGLAASAAKKFPERSVVGIEGSLFPFMLSWLRTFFLPKRGNLQFLRENFFNSSFKDFSVVLCYLSNPIMAGLKEKLIKELPEGAVIISSTFFIPDWEPEEVIEVKGFWPTKIFVYKERK